MEITLTAEAFLGAGLIFLLRVGDMTLDTLRLLMVMRGKKAYAWLLGFVQAAIFIVAISSVLQNVSNVLNVVGYAGGFATGNVIGIWLEEKLAIGHSHLRVTSSRRGAATAEALRNAGYAVTEIPARGRDGAVTLLTLSVLRKNVNQVKALIKEIDPNAFITVEDVRPVWRGFWRA